MTTTLPHAAPETQGVDPAGILGFLDAIDTQPAIELHSLMVIRHGHVVAEGWWAPYVEHRPHLLYSLSKSFTSTAAGLAVEEGLLDLDRTVLSYFPELDGDITDPRSRRMLVRHIAAMASGHRSETLERAIAADPTNPVRGFLLTPPEEEPGTVFAYNQPCTFTLGAIIQRASGQRLTDYLRPRLLDPLGIGEVGWQGVGGIDMAFSGLHATTDAIARLGLLYLQRGMWEGRRLLPESWVDAATSLQVANPAESNPDWSQGYGFQFWMARHGYRGDGAFGQFCIVLPEQDAVIVTTAQTHDMQGILDVVWEHLLPALDAPVGEPGSDAGRRLAERLTSLALPGSTLPELLEGDSGLLAPRGGHAGQQPSLTGARLVANPDGARLELHEGAVVHRVPVGLRGEWGIGDEGVPMAASGGATAVGGGGSGSHVEVIFLETPHRLLLDLDPASGAFDARWLTPPLRPGKLADLRMPRRD